MSPKQSVKTCFANYANFTGRAKRSEFWWFFLFQIIGLSTLGAIDARIFGFGDLAPTPFSTTFSLVMFVPMLAVYARRLHDKDRSGWWMLLWMLPVFGWLVLIFWLATEGTEGDNQFGPEPVMDAEPVAARPRRERPEPAPQETRVYTPEPESEPREPTPAPERRPRRAATVSKRNEGPTIRRG